MTGGAAPNPVTGCHPSCTSQSPLEPQTPNPKPYSALLETLRSPPEPQSINPEPWRSAGDTAVLVGGEDGRQPYHQLLGRTSVDIIKHGGYKVGAWSFCFVPC